MICAICEKRKAKRDCPARGARICPQCCGEHREKTFVCPFDCAYLMEARSRERKPPENAGGGFPETRIDERFVNEHADMIAAAAQTVFEAAMESGQAVDSDAAEALDALIKTYKTLESGIYYETKPSSAYARRIAASLQDAIDEYRSAETEERGFSRTRDSDVLKALVFLRRLALDRDNGRPRGRAFLHLLSERFGGRSAAQAGSGLVLPGF